MTLSDIRYQLINFFCDKDVFGEENLDKIKVSKELESNKKEMVRVTLEDMVKDDMVRKVGDYTYILTIPLQAGGYDVGISNGTCMAIRDIIHTFRQANNLEGEPVDPFEIHEGHIIFLINIIGNLVETESKQ